MNAFMNYFRHSLEELRQVRWPTRQQAIRLTVITIGFIAVSAAFLGLVDSFITQIVRWSLGT